MGRFSGSDAPPPAKPDYLGDAVSALANTAGSLYQKAKKKKDKNAGGGGKGSDSEDPPAAEGY
jgi:hypothetical protein